MSQFKKGDKVRIKTGISNETHAHDGPGFVGYMDDLIGQVMAVDKYTDAGYVACQGMEWVFLEDWLEHYK